MCSWCWGFSPVIEALHKEFSNQLSVLIILGGLRSGTTEAVTDSLRDEIFHHWHEVQQLTGQPFTFDNAMPGGFIYNTEPACRAVVTAGEINPVRMLDYFKAVQHAFYVEQRDVTSEDVLVDLCHGVEMAPAEFKQHFHSNTIIEKTAENFSISHQYRIRSFPTLILENRGQEEIEIKMLSRGFRKFDGLKDDIYSWLNSC